MAEDVTRRHVLSGALACAMVSTSAWSQTSTLPTLPQTNDGTWSSHPLWTVLRQSHLTVDANGLVRAAFTPQVMKLAGKPMTITGFVMPIDGNALHHFVLSRYSPECPFCPAGGPTETIEVWADQPVGRTQLMVTMHGLFTIQGNMEVGLFYRLNHAVLV